MFVTFSYFHIWWALFIDLISLNHVKLGDKVTFVKHIASVVSLIFLG